jgi:hypothetical protein
MYLLVSNKPIKECSFRREVKEAPLAKNLLNEAQLRSMIKEQVPSTSYTTMVDPIGWAAFN